MKRLLKAMDIIHHNVTKRDYDNVLLLVGDEGIGKSNVNMHLVEDWCLKNFGECNEEHIKYICLDRLEFVRELKDAKRFDIIVDDEAADISSKRSMSNFNVQLSQAYQIIRGDNLVTILTIPSPFDLDAFFVKRRARGMIEVTGRGRLRYFSKNKLKRIIELNQNRIVKRIGVVRPTFVDTFPKYKGVLLEPYKEKKAEKMKEVRKKLYEKVQELESGKTKTNERDKLIHSIKEKIGATKTAELVGISRRQVHNIAVKCAEGSE